MSAPRLEIRLDSIGHNARILVQRLGTEGITVCGVTKATLGSPEVARELLAAGVTSLGESRVENIENLRRAGITAPITLIRSPMASQVDRVVAGADSSLNSEIDVIERLSMSARQQGTTTGSSSWSNWGISARASCPTISSTPSAASSTCPNIVLRGIGANLACQNGVIPDQSNMAELSALATSVETTFGIDLDIVSGGNSANLPWALEPRVDIGRVNHLRLGESVFLGREPIRRTVIDGLHADAVVRGRRGDRVQVEAVPTAGRPRSDGVRRRGRCAVGADGDGGTHRVIVALGRQDTRHATARRTGRIRVARLQQRPPRTRLRAERTAGGIRAPLRGELQRVDAGDGRHRSSPAATSDPNSFPRRRPGPVRPRRNRSWPAPIP